MLLAITASLILSGCAKRYVVSTPTVAPPPAATSAASSPDCKPYVLLNAGLAYVPFNQLSGKCGEPEAKESALLLEPGMKLRLRQFALTGETFKEGRQHESLFPKDLQISQVPTVTSFEWVKPGPNDPLTRTDYFFLSYLAAAGFPIDDKSTFYPFTFLQDAHTETGCQQTCAARSALESLKIYFRDYGNHPGNVEVSAAWVRDLLNPLSYSPNERPEHLGLTLGDKNIALFDLWDDPQFVSPPLDANDEKRGRSSLYRDEFRIYTGHSLVEIEIPIRLSGDVTSRFAPVYWSIEDAEKAYGVTIVGLRRKTCYLTNTALQSLVPAATKKSIESSSAATVTPCTTNRDDPPSLVRGSYFTLWLKKTSWREQRSASNWGAPGYVVLSKDPKKDASQITAAKQNMLLAPGDILLVANDAKTVDNPGHH